MKIKTILIILLSLWSYTAFAEKGVLEKVSATDLQKISIADYGIDSDQAFKIVSGPFKNKLIFFASFNPSDPAKKTGSALPKIFMADGNQVIDSQTIPTLTEGWNLVQVDAVSFSKPLRADSALRVLAILTIEPISQRSEDYWQQAFVFDLLKNGKIETNTSLNEKISKVRPWIKSIKSLKEFLN